MNTYFTKLIPHLFILLGLVFWSACGGEKSESDAIEVSESTSGNPGIFVTKDQFETMKMEWGTLDSRTFSEELSIQGSIKVPVEGMQDITAYYGGYVSGLKLIEGEEVKRGQVLFYLENPEFVRLQQEYLEVKSQIGFLKAEFERQETLYSEQIASQKNLLKTKADYQSALAKEASLKEQLRMIHIDADELKPENIRSRAPIIAPISGFVEEIFVVPGAYLQASDRALSLLNKDHLHVEFKLFEKDASKLQVGQKIKVRIPEEVESTFEAEVYVIGQAVNLDRQILVHAHLNDEVDQKKLVPGMYVEGKLQLAPEEGMSLPETAVLSEDDKSYILILSEENEKGYELEKIEVTIGPTQEGYTQVNPKKDINSDRQVLVKGGFSLI
ncbi:efflux RND transporter periplasmic adaptor subunit [Algoriphagus hitonicola]|uniref:Membrane fusion protein, cobalt-zinc-cadmium efflux system n=1 Tax=Algoriphagus hitonicola TaxID=435880 RepID=A0A1I2T789_9BACT|nr:efflux RND transporter periplasmic adaptor subunit [Algoriphagus hitonicola]SFG60803.1 membrane fusion protein, cobalt-zinc-cadmium efflux system [Algoriphagus hitonicola]